MQPIDSGLKATVVQDSYLDQQGLNSIKSMGRDKDPQALKEIAKKFEAMFVQQMLKTMREANDVFAEDGYFNSQESRFHRDMMDQQMVLNLTSGAGIGLATQFYRQMSQAYGQPTDEVHNSPDTLGELHKINAYDLPTMNTSMTPSSMDEWMNAYVGSKTQPVKNAPVMQTLGVMNNAPISASSATRSTKEEVASTPEEFVAMLKPHAEKAAQELKINPDVLIAQVALETGWGKHVIHNRHGENSFNLFNIKAGSGWQGNKVNVSTLEYQGGVAAIEKADFRQYNNYADSFSDYVRLMKNNPRYQDVVQTGKNSAAYADALQSAGYATDPEYANKIKQILDSDVIRDFRNLAQGVSANTQQLLSLAANLRRSLVE